MTSVLLCAVPVGVLLLHILVNLSDLREFLLAPSTYPIGAEMAGFRYRTAAHYVLLGTTEIVLATTGLMLPFVTRPQRAVFLRAATAAALLLTTAILGCSNE